MKSSTVNYAVLSVLPTVQAWKLARQGNGYINYTTITGFFMQDEADTDPSTFDYVSSQLLSVNARI